MKAVFPSGRSSLGHDQSRKASTSAGGRGSRRHDLRLHLGSSARRAIWVGGPNAAGGDFDRIKRVRGSREANEQSIRRVALRGVLRSGRVAIPAPCRGPSQIWRRQAGGEASAGNRTNSSNAHSLDSEAGGAGTGTVGTAVGPERAPIAP